RPLRLQWNGFAARGTHESPIRFLARLRNIPDIKPERPTTFACFLLGETCADIIDGSRPFTFFRAERRVGSRGARGSRRDAERVRAARIEDRLRAWRLRRRHAVDGVLR